MSFGMSDFLALLPLVVVTAAAVLAMLAAAFFRRAVLALTLLGLALACAALPLSLGAGPVAMLLVLDEYAIGSMALIFGATFVIALLAYGYFGGRDSDHESLYVLFLLAALGAAVLVSSAHFAAFFLGLELLSISLFAMIAYWRGAEPGIEAGIKYLVLAGLASSFLLFGMALIYARSGTLQFAQMDLLLPATGPADPYVITGLALIVVGIGFKLALVPFHMWTPDVYQGAPAPVAAFVATVSKGAALVLLLRYFAAIGGHRSAPLDVVLTLLAVASILAGNLLALLQDNLKRMLAYSSISHLGYLLVAFLATGALSLEAIGYYLVAYFVSMIGAFGVIGALSDARLGRDRDALSDYRGLFWTHPWLASVFTAMLLSLAGIPLTMGFIGKFYILAAGVDSSLWLLVAVLVVGSVIGLFYYLRVIAAMCAAPEERALPLRAALEGNVVLAGLTVVLVVLGVYPAPLIRLLQAASGGF